ncbi:hypothetical protein DICSQDRAFT_175882 [Dichomitus squalens LYAD-421 SS1]|uniref:Uncharacterized protein n=1 Tax=Dichomitus squalens (strain LYAD-421) TaxID=732165 RepID=R7SI95_DICSQ|nr:uncharacterized protein DICSQDRAFT_175882 [Dichomitus squalens LYAD-421 SS1]EJF55455.1 hypothetical protein DICSQDRAFT_175882 [Dichomitus squalens LYAD-421 SS1]
MAHSNFMQAEGMRSLGWAEFMTVEMANNRQTMAVKYWVPKSSPPNQKRPPQQRPLPSLSGKLTISIVQVKEKTGRKGFRSPRARVEHMRFDVHWEPENGALGVIPALEDLFMPPEQLRIDLDMESLLRTVIRWHTEGVMKFFQTQLQRGTMTRNIFSPQGDVVFVSNEGSPSSQIHLCADKVVIVTVDPRTERLTLRDTGDLAAAGREPRFAAITQPLNDAPFMLPQALVLLRNATITDLAEQKVQYLGLQSYRTRNFSADEIKKLGQDAQGHIYIQLGNFPTHYLVLVIIVQDFRYALISAKEVEHSMNHDLVMEDIGWLNVRRIHGNQVTIEGGMGPDPITGQKRKREDGMGRVGPSGEQYPASFRLETNVLRELYAYCW